MSGPAADGERDVVLASPPALGPLYARALLTARRRRQLVLPARATVVAAAPVEVERVAAYARTCGWGLRDDVPVTYPHLLTLGAQVHLLVTEPFPVAALGVVHLRQRIVARRPLRVGERPRVRVHAQALAPHPRGATVDLVAVVDVDGEPVWEGTSTYLSRGARLPATAGPAEPATAEDVPGVPGPPSALWRVGADTGRRYAAVSGDVNPIHLSAPTARLLGFPRAIAHGMWTLARALAPLQPRLPGAVEVDAAFRSPVRLPSTVALALRRAPVAEGWDVTVRSASGERLHLAATVRHVSVGASAPA